MRKFIGKYGNIVLFAVIMLICAAFFVQVTILGADYSDSVAAQAAERAGYYAAEQSLAVRNQIEDKRARAETLAGTVAKCENLDGVHLAIEEFCAEAGRADSTFTDAAYVKAGKIYSRAGEVLEYPELTSLAEARLSGGMSRVFQYENRVMAFGIYAKVYDGVVDAVLPVYDRTAVSLVTAKDTLKNSDSASADKCFTIAAFSLLCKHDGKILDRDVNDKSFDISAEAVQNGVLFSVVTDGTKYEEAVRLVNVGESGTIITRIGTEQYAVAINALGTENGNLFLLDLFRLSDVYGGGYESVSQIMGTLLGLALVTVLLCVVFIVNRRRTDKLIYSLEMVNAELDCGTPRKFEEYAGEILRRHKNSQFAVVAAKINNFRYTEEHFGDETVKSLLVHMRNAIRFSVLPAETFGYYGDGEFFILLNYRDRKNLEDRIGAIFRAIERFDFEGGEDFKITMSFSVYEVERELNQSVKKMEDKVRILQRSGGMKSGAFSLEYYGDVVRADYFKKAEIEGRMESALAGNEFHLFYQPKFNLRRGDLDGSEILVRWYDPKIEAYRKPAEFLPVFEEDGFIDKLDRFVFFRACENVAERVEQGMRVYPVSVNVSRVTAIRADFLTYYKKVKEKFGIRDGFVTLEFTESFAYENYEYLSKIVTELHAAGFKCSLDDFGTGYSSYNVLKTLDMDEIKLDKFFLDKGVDDARDEMILSSVVNIVKKMGVKVTQEGVETKEDFEKLKAMGCDVIQGYYFSKPMKYVDYLEFVRKNFSND